MKAIQVLKTKSWAFSSSVIDKDKPFALPKWAIRFNKDSLALKLIPLIKRRLDHEDIEKLLLAKPDPTIPDCMKNNELSS